MTNENELKPITLPAEWEHTGAVMMALPHPDTDWADILDEAIECFRNMIDAISRYAVVVVATPSVEWAAGKIGDLVDRHPGRIALVEVPTNDTWTRDYGPITVADSEGKCTLLDFTFNGWGMKFAADRDNLVNSNLDKAGFWRVPLRSCRQMVLEGGSIDSDGEGHMLTTAECLLSPNRNPWLSREEIDAELRRMFGLKKVLWIDHGALEGDDTDSHVDTLARFAPGRTIVYVRSDDPTDSHHGELEAMRADIEALTDADGRPFNTVGLPLPDAIHDAEGNRLPATYANFLVLPDVIIMPTYSQPRKDELARQILNVVYEREVVTVDCLALIKQHGSLHCSTMQIPLEATPLG